ncbi:MAG: CapA family protein, partial [Lachnospiraceae bacterium]|nr:CapA family protein [Lachnospiraceae bacterium]
MRKTRLLFVKITQILIFTLLLLSLTGCNMLDAIGNALGFPIGNDTKDTAEANAVETVEEGAPPVIVIEEPKEEEVPDAVEEEPEEEEEEYIRDPDNKIYSMIAADKDEVSLSFIGDINFCEDYANMRVLRDQEGGNLSGCILPDVIETMKDADIMMANNEFAYSDRGSPTAGKKYTFRAKPEHADKLDELGIDIVALANNHAYDWGPDALI